MLVLGALAAALLAPVAMAAHASSPVVKLQTKQLGAIVATRGHLAVYTWNKEKDKKVHCTGACARAWPPVLVAKGVAAHLPGLMGRFGTIKRPGGKTQLTLNGRPLYTFNEDTPTKILCNGVDGWFVVRA